MKKNDVNVEYINNGTPTGPVTAALMDGQAGMEARYRSFESLPERAWKYLDDRMVTVAKAELVGIADLNKYPDTNINFDGVSASVFTKDRVSEMGDAKRAMSPDNRGDAAIVDFDTIGVPLFVTFKDFWVDRRRMQSAARENISLYSQSVDEATRSVSRHLESMLFNGSYNAAGSTAYGYTTFPDRQTHTISTSWSTAEPDEILADVNAMISKSMQANHMGPWMLYIPWQYQVRLNQDYTVGTNDYPVSGSIQNRLMQLPGLDGIRVSSYLANDNVVLVEMNSSTVQLINGLPMSVQDWEPANSNNWKHLFKVLTIAVPFLYSDYDGQCGIVHGSV